MLSGARRCLGRGIWPPTDADAAAGAGQLDHVSAASADAKEAAVADIGPAEPRRCGGCVQLRTDADFTTPLC